MEELIKEAEDLYLELSRITDSLVYARLHDDNDLLHGCRNELENYAQSVMQTLKCLIDRKDNIVDLGEVWHWYKDEKPRHMDDLCFFVLNGIPVTGVHNMIGLERFIDSCYGKNFCYGNKFEAHSIRWAYCIDLLPKGGE